MFIKFACENFTIVNFVSVEKESAMMNIASEQQLSYTPLATFLEQKSQASS